MTNLFVHHLVYMYSLFMVEYWGKKNENGSKCTVYGNFLLISMQYYFIKLQSLLFGTLKLML